MLAAWRQGRDTHDIATNLFQGDDAFRRWVEPRICEIIAAEQDRLYRKRQRG